MSISDAVGAFLLDVHLRGCQSCLGLYPFQRLSEPSWSMIISEAVRAVLVNAFIIDLILRRRTVLVNASVLILNHGQPQRSYSTHVGGKRADMVWSEDYKMCSNFVVVRLKLQVS
ncbi:hypothetical protein BgiBS90_003734 [Biomphalaria glabrata]|nr:hypothetical protein BgiBS90_003734 [Biomphalaria glabrata]